MATMTISVPDDLKARMDSLDTVNWSAVARHALIEEVQSVERFRLLSEFKKIVAKSKFTEKDADEMSEKVKKSMHDSLVQEGLI